MEESKKDTGMHTEESSIEDDVTIASRETVITKHLSEVDVSLLNVEAIQDPIHKTRQSGHCIILYLPAILEPIQLWNQTHIILGRNDDPLDPHLTVDLAEHHAALLGVSRIHAEIIYEDANYYVKDLGSKNGTWVNKTRLILDQKIKITNHDTLRLAHFMIQISSYQNKVPVLPPAD